MTPRLGSTSPSAPFPARSRSSARATRARPPRRPRRAWASTSAGRNRRRAPAPERPVPGSEPELREVDKSAPAQATEEVLVLDFGGQYPQLIARRIRECGVFSELLPHDIPLERIKERGPKGLVLSGGPAS